MKNETGLFSPAPGDSALDLGVLVLPDTNMLSLSAAIDPLRAANRRAGAALYRWRFLTPEGAPVRLTSGATITGDALARAPVPQALVVLAGFNLDRHLTEPLRRQLRRMAPQLQGLGAVDGGPWALARAGLLDGHRATTHWEDLEAFAAAFPEVEVVADRYTLSGRIFTTGGAMPCIDMMLHLIRTRQGPGLAARVASAFIHDIERPASAPQSRVGATVLHRAAPQVAEAASLMERLIETPPSIAAIAARVRLSPRRLETLFLRDLGVTPGQFFRQLRLAEARRMVTDTALPMTEIAVRTGFSSQAAFSRAFRQTFGLAPSGLRNGAGRGAGASGDRPRHAGRH